MKQRPRIYYSESQKALMWERWRAGDNNAANSRLPELQTQSGR